MSQQHSHTAPPFFSVLVPSFSQQEQTRQTVESVLAQSFGEFEVIVVDNWSLDGTFEEFANHSDPRVGAIRPARHGLPAVMLEHAWQGARGRFVAILSAGDAFIPDALRSFKEAIGSQKAQFLSCRPAEYFDHRLPESDGRHANAGYVSVPSVTGRVLRIPSVAYLSSLYSLEPFFSWQPSGHVFDRALATEAATLYQGLFRGPTPQAHGWPALASLTSFVTLVDRPLFVRHQAPRVPLGAASDGSTEAEVFDVHEGWEVDLTELPVKAHAMIAALADGLWGIQRHPNAQSLRRYGRDEHRFAELLVAEIAARERNGFRVAPDEPERVAQWRTTLPAKPNPIVMANRVQARVWSKIWGLQGKLGAKDSSRTMNEIHGSDAMARACEIVAAKS